MKFPIFAMKFIILSLQKDEPAETKREGKHPLYPKKGKLWH